MTSETELFYIQRIAEPKKQVAELTATVAKLLKVNAELKDKIVQLSKNSSNSSKPPSSDILKPPQDRKSSKRRRQGGQPGHPGVNQQPFAREQIDDIQEIYAEGCDCGCRRRGQKLEQVRVRQFAELLDKPLIVTEYRLHGYVCPGCGQTVWAQLPEGVVHKRLFAWKSARKWGPDRE